MARTRTAAVTATLALALALAGACWVVAIRQMQGMDMGAGTELGSLGFFIGAWVPMMAAMMLPGAAPAVSRFVRTNRRAVAGPLFAASYVAVWALFGLAVYAVYQPHSTSIAGVLVIAAGLYELTPLKRYCRRRCRSSVRSGFQFGFYCLGSSIGLMVVLVALGVMSIAWTIVVAALVLAQKLLPPRPWVDVPVALAIVGVGILVLT
jgi:predicted metal-binding membrane protein